MAKEGAARKHLVARSWKHVRNADINISSPSSTAVYYVEYLNPFNNDSCAVVNGDPGCSFVVCVAHSSVWPATCNKCVINTAQMQTYPGIPGVRSMGLVSLYTHSLIIIGIGIDFDTVNTLVMYFPIFICNREDIE